VQFIRLWLISWGNSLPVWLKVLIIGGGDGGIARELDRYPSVKEVVLCEIDEVCVSVLTTCTLSYYYLLTGQSDKAIDICPLEWVLFLSSLNEQLWCDYWAYASAQCSSSALDTVYCSRPENDICSYFAAKSIKFVVKDVNTRVLWIPRPEPSMPGRSGPERAETDVLEASRLS